ncbi:MAG: LysM peptidoglycan-binding domain-containing protein [Chitinophagaceae bacterium]|nr:LysM peptidoglycan-binding domain-containing protein [Chitinophagaceae bacterium]
MKPLFFFLILFSIAQNSFSLDSLKTEVRNGTTYVTHKVELGETLFGISRRYGSTVADILELNKGNANTLSVGLEIQILYNSKKISSVKPEKITNTSDSNATIVIHAVEKGQTLYSISRMYNVKIEEIVLWNNLPPNKNQLTNGQQLTLKIKKDRTPLYHIVQGKETMFSISQKYNISIAHIKKWNNIQDNALSVGQKIIITAPKDHIIEPTQIKNNETPTNAKKDSTKEEKDKKNTGNPESQIENTIPEINTSVIDESNGFTKIIEDGFASIIENSPDTRKFLALHPTAPIGSILEIKNLENNQIIYARVIGQLPKIGSNNKILVRLSQRAYQRLGSSENKVPVLVTYVP